jgi:uncharacterized protein (TIGR03435 family)
MSHHIGDGLGFGRRFLLATIGVASVAGPFAIGLMGVPQSQAQSQESARLGFDVASVKQSKPGSHPNWIQFFPGGRFTATNATLKGIIEAAYHIRDFQLSGTPTWIDSEMYNIEAKPGAPCKRDQARMMLRALLAERFKLTLRHEAKEISVYALVLAKHGPKLSELKRNPTDEDGNFRIGAGALNGQGVSMSDLADALSRLMDRTVLDRTGLEGIFDLKLTWTPESDKPSDHPGEDGGQRPRSEERELPRPDPNGPSIFAALQDQLGLKIESQKGPVEIFVIEHVERPAEN